VDETKRIKNKAYGVIGADILKGTADSAQESHTEKVAFQRGEGGGNRRSMENQGNKRKGLCGAT
jgi:hypothetical protein